MQPTILFGGENREHFVSVASAQAISDALPDADLWFWRRDGIVGTCDRGDLLDHARPFEIELPGSGAAIGPIEVALDRARQEQRVLLLALHGGSAENGELAAMCEARGVPFTGSGSSASRLAFDKVAAKAAVAAAGLCAPATIAIETTAAGLAEHGRLVAKPVADGSSYGLMFVDGFEDLAALQEAAGREAYLIEPFVAGVEATCGVVEQDGELIALPPVEIRPAGSAFDYEAKYLSVGTSEICPAGFRAEVNDALRTAALTAHRAVGASGYSRSDFIVADDGVIFIEINTLPGLTRSSLFPKELVAHGIAFGEFLRSQIDLAKVRPH